MRGKWLLFAVTAILLAVAAGALSLLRREAALKSADKAQAQAASPAEAAVSLPGKIQAQKVVAVPAPLEGSIDEFLADAGDEVFEGQLLARLRNTKLESARDAAAGEAERAQSRVNRTESVVIAARLEASRARADATRARSEAERTEKTFLRQQLLYREGATPRLVFEKAQKEHAAAQAEASTLEELAKQSEERVATLVRELDSQRKTLEEKNEELEQATSDLAATEVHAPVDGLLVSRRGQPGQEVDRDWKDLFQIAVDLSVLEVVVEPEPAVLARIQTGRPVSVHVAEVPDESITGTIKDVKDGHVVVEFRNPSPAVKPGLTAQVRMTVK